MPYSGGELGGITVDSTNGFIYWGDFGQGRIWQADLAGNNNVPFLEGQVGASLAYGDGYLFWHDYTNLRRYQVGVGPVETLISESCFLGELAIDINADQLYYGTCAGTLTRLNYDGTNQEGLIFEIDLKGLDLNLTTNRMYFSESGPPDNLRSANLDGSGQTLLLTSQDIHVLAVDPVNEQLYWASSWNGIIYQVNLDGTGTIPFISTSVSFGGLAIYLP